MGESKKTRELVPNQRGTQFQLNGRFVGGWGGEEEGPGEWKTKNEISFEGFSFFPRRLSIGPRPRLLISLSITVFGLG